MISKLPEKLGVIVEHFIGGQEFRREFKDPSAVKASFPNIPVMVLTETAQPHLLKRLKVIYYTQLFWVFENHVISRCRDLFPLAFSSAEKSHENEAVRIVEDYSSLFVTIRHKSSNSRRLFVTIRHYSHCSYHSLFATIRYSGFPDTPSNCYTKTNNQQSFLSPVEGLTLEKSASSSLHIENLTLSLFQT